MNLARSWSRLWDEWLPARCPVCGRSGEAWCEGCRPSPRALVGILGNGVPLAYRAPYAGDWAAVLRAWKLGRRHDLTPLLACEARLALAEVKPPSWEAPALLVPVPPRAATLRRRGVDLVGGLAAAMAEGDPSIVAVRALHWGRQPREQVGAGRRARWANVAGALRADRVVAGRAVLVCDDITTTGATLLAAAAAVVAAGASGTAVLALGAARQDDPTAPFRLAEG